MSNDSSTGGPLAPASVPAPLEGQALNRFIQQWVVGIVGLDGTLVRPRYQPEQPDIPDAAVAWAAIGVTTRKTDNFPAIIHDGDGDGGEGTDELHRHEEYTVFCSFYDLGTNGLADYYATLLRDGVAIGQNLEILQLNDMAFAWIGDMTPVPSLLKQRWLYRVDISLTLRRRILRVYPVRNILSAEGTVETDSGFTDTFNA